MKNKIKISFCIILLFTIVSCKNSTTVETKPLTIEPQKFLPQTDPLNTLGWKYKENLSDEFNSTGIDQTKWLIQGTNGVFQSNTIGRAPSQYSTNNAFIRDNKLVISLKWEPSFAFSSTLDASGVKYENYTTAAVICKNEFLYGYMEARCKAADASVSSSFWATGNNAELDIFEHFGKPSIKNDTKIKLETEMWSSVHDWNKAGGPSIWTKRTQVPFRVADDFHVYACEWDAENIKFYADGKLISAAKRAELLPADILTKPIKLWFNSVTWTWHGLPLKEELPTSFEIDYLRVWQK